MSRIPRNRSIWVCFLLGFVLLLTGCQEPDQTEEPRESQMSDQITGEESGQEVEYFKLDQELGEYQSWDVLMGDLDDDGSLDLFIASLGQNDPKIWLNDGSGNFLPAEEEIPGCARAAVGDVNGDGRLDIIVAEYQPDKLLWSSLLSVWLNDGSGTFSSGESLAVTEGVQRILVGDLNADQVMDLFVLGTGQNEVWINDGNGTFDYLAQDLPTGIDSAGGIGDLDGDGDLDILAGGWDGPPAAWMNDGAGYFSKSEISITDENLHIHGLALGDLDSDGDLDAFVTLANRDPHQIWTNDGEGGFLFSQGLPALLGHAVVLGDLDGDGDLDAATGHGNQGRGYVRLWLNDGQAKFSDSSVMLGENFTSALVLGDLDLDQDLDIVSAQSAWGEEIGPSDMIWINLGPN